MIIYHSTQFQIPRNCAETIVHCMLNFILYFPYSFISKKKQTNKQNKTKTNEQTKTTTTIGHIPRIPVDELSRQ